MPMLIQHIDAIARAMKRDVVFATFPACGLSPEGETNDWENYEPREELIAWLDENGISWMPCAFFADERTLIFPYDGRIYIDVPYDLLDRSYQKVSAHLENPDGTPRIVGVRFWYVPIDMAMKNKHHDDPGYWEKRAEEW
ncbi:hypothetical protein [Burkholderia sp. AU38729]|uniref:hypothetical protein n=1 Tax=Burkholderia sp. AU38729 TaxID=2879633 RepID=UPI001CF12448|nr:hypothetical protein [Burkholderia sp. AU38729]MCA8067407.1 hypothetical protein [Burkholderia sp. AU38729]